MSAHGQAELEFLQKVYCSPKYNLLPLLSENTFFLKTIPTLLQKYCFFVSECQELISIYVINSYSFQHKAPILRAAFMNNNVQNVMNLKKKILWQEKKVAKNI